MASSALTGAKIETHQLLRAAHKPEKNFPVLRILGNTLLNWLLFLYEMCICAFWLHMYQWWAYFVLGPLAGLAICAWFIYNRIKNYRMRNNKRGGIARGAGSVLAIVMGVGYGEYIFQNYSQDYYNFMDLAIYTNIDPNVDRGQTYMDAGQVYFKEYTYVDLQYPMAIQSKGLYCVAPIRGQPIVNQGGPIKKELQGPLVAPRSGTFDFWAVGKDCCDPPNGANFRCGEVKSPFARAGLRQLADEERPFYRMAVQSWQFKYNLPAKHPLFFEYVQDPLHTVQQRVDTALNLAFQAMWVYLIFDLILVSFLFWYLNTDV